MMKSLRSMALVAVGALALSACGLLAGLIPDQEISGGVLGLGGGVNVPLAASGVDVAEVQTSAVTTWVGTIEKSFSLAGLGLNVPVSPAGLTEAIELGNAIVVRNPGAATGPFTVTGLALGGSFTVDTQTFPVPAGVAVTGLAVSFAGPSCVAVGTDQVCTYTTIASDASVELEFAATQVQAFWNLLKTVGGNVSVDLTVTVTLAGPGLPAGATVTVTLASGGATIKF